VDLSSDIQLRCHKGRSSLRRRDPWNRRSFPPLPHARKEGLGRACRRTKGHGSNDRSRKSRLLHHRFARTPKVATRRRFKKKEATSHEGGGEVTSKRGNTIFRFSLVWGRIWKKGTLESRRENDTALLEKESLTLGLRFLPSGPAVREKRRLFSQQKCRDHRVRISKLSASYRS